jgi:hypothetical protein
VKQMAKSNDGNGRRIRPSRRRRRGFAVVEEFLGALLFTSFLLGEKVLETGYVKASQTKYAAETSAGEAASQTSYQSCMASAGALSKMPTELGIGASIESFPFDFSKTKAMLAMLTLQDVSSVMKQLDEPGRVAQIRVGTDSLDVRFLFGHEKLRVDTARTIDCDDPRRVDLDGLLKMATDPYFKKFGVY